MKNRTFLTFVLSALMLASCNKQKITQLENELSNKKQEVTQLQQQVDYLQKNNSSLLDRMADLSVVSKAGATSIQESLKTLSNQYDYIQNLNTKIQSKDSLNLALVMNLKRSLNDINDEDVQVEIRGGKVHVSISDKLLFTSGSSKITSRADAVLGKIAEVISDHDQLDVMVEGHTDDVPMANSCVEDNWDLSVKRATSVVRVLTKDYYVDPERLTAAGRAEYLPRAENDTAEGRSMNRRTEIVIMPKLDQFFKLLEAPEVKQ